MNSKSNSCSAKSGLGRDAWGVVVRYSQGTRARTATQYVMCLKSQFIHETLYVSSKDT